MKSLFNKAVEWGHLRVSPAAKVGKLREDNRRVRFLTEQEIDQLLKAADLQLKIFLIISLNTGPRKTNVLNLRWEDIDMTNGVIHVLKTKSGKPYEVPINDALRKVLIELGKKGTDGKVIEMPNLQKLFAKAVRESGVKDCRIHTLRHTFASHLVMRGANLFTVSQFLGHSNTKMTARYSHLSPKFQKIEANLIGFGGPKRESEKKVQEPAWAYSEN